MSTGRTGILWKTPEYSLMTEPVKTGMVNTVRALEEHWKSIGRALEEHWKSTGRALEEHWKSTVIPGCMFKLQPPNAPRNQF